MDLKYYTYEFSALEALSNQWVFAPKYVAALSEDFNILAQLKMETGLAKSQVNDASWIPALTKMNAVKDVDLNFSEQKIVFLKPLKGNRPFEQIDAPNVIENTHSCSQRLKEVLNANEHWVGSEGDKHNIAKFKLPSKDLTDYFGMHVDDALEMSFEKDKGLTLSGLTTGKTTFPVKGHGSARIVMKRDIQQMIVKSSIGEEVGIRIANDSYVVVKSSDMNMLSASPPKDVVSRFFKERSK